MVVQSGLVKTAFVFSTVLSVSLLAVALPAFAQVSADEVIPEVLPEALEVLNVAEDETVPAANSEAIEAQIISGDISEEDSEAAMLEIADAIAMPGASALDGLTSASLDLSTLTAESVPALKTALNSDNDLTQLYAADALWTLTGDSELVLPTLISAAASNNLSTRQLATAAIAHLGQRALPAIPVLNQLIGSSDSRTRSLAQDTLSIITSNNRPTTTLGIIRREVRRSILVPAAIRAINYLWR